jgi:hypothetical protein
MGVANPPRELVAGLVDALGHPHFAVRARAARAAVPARDGVPAAALRRLLGDRHPDVQAAADASLRSAPPAAATPDSAARLGVPEPFARALATAPAGDLEVVLLGLNEPPALWTEAVVCRPAGGGWSPGPASLRPGWIPAGPGRLGVAALWGWVPDGFRRVHVEWRGEERSVPVRGGWFLFAGAGAGRGEARPRVTGLEPARRAPRPPIALNLLADR